MSSSTTGRRIERWSAIALGIMTLAGSATPARAAVLAGTCVVKVTVDYGTIEVEPATGSFSFSSTGGNACKGAGVAPTTVNLNATVDLDSTGTSSATRSCELTTAEGTYFANFTNGFEDSDGSFVFAGNLLAATIVLRGGPPPDTDPTFVGTVDLVIDPLTPSNSDEVLGCPSTNPTTIVYVGTLTFTEST